MGPWRRSLHACPCVSLLLPHCFRTATRFLCVRQFAHSHDTSPIPIPIPLNLPPRPYWLTRDSALLRDDDDDKATLVRQVLDLTHDLSVKHVLTCWVQKLGSKPGSKLNSAVRYVRYEQVARTVNAVLQELGQKGHANAALEVFQWMELQGWCRLDPHLYTTVIDALGSSGCLELAEKIFTDMKDSVRKDTVLYNSLLHARSQAGHVDAAVELFQAMKEKNCKPDLFTYNTVMSMYVKAETGLAKVVSVFKEMCLLGIQPDVVSYDILLAACASGDRVKEAERVFGAMKKRGVKPTVVTYTSLITVYANSGDFRSAMQVFGDMVAGKCEPNVKTFTSLINACRRDGHVEDAQSIFEAMKEYGVKPNVMAYNALINVYTERGEQSRAQSVFLEMVQAGLQPTGVSFTVLMSSFKATGSFNDALSIYDQAKQLNTVCGVQTYTEALDNCAKAKNIAGMIRVLNDMRIAASVPNCVTCTVLLVALSSKCSNNIEVSSLLQSLEGFQSEPVQCCYSLLTDSAKTDHLVTNVLGRCFSSITQGDSKTWTALGSSLLDALWALGWYRRAAIVLGWLCDNRDFYNDLCTVTPNEWKLDVRRLSSGGATVALYQWLAHLLAAAQYQGDIEYTDLNEKFVTKVEVNVFFLPHYQEQQSLLHESVDLMEEQKGFPRFVTVVSGWGKLSKEEGRSHVKASIENEMIKLGAPFRTSDDAGRWSANGEALQRWLLRPETPSRLILWDTAARNSH